MRLYTVAPTDRTFPLTDFPGAWNAGGFYSEAPGTRRCRPTAERVLAGWGLHTHTHTHTDTDTVTCSF